MRHRIFCLLTALGVLSLGISIVPPAWATGSQPNDHAGGTLRILAQSDAGTLDPQISYVALTKMVETPVYDTLLTYPKFAGLAAQPVIANLAEAVPTPEDGGRTYRLTLREGLHFSNGAPVTVEDVAASFRRLFKVGSPTAGPYYGALVGAQACLELPATCTLAGGIETHPQIRQIVFHLTEPDPEFLDRLAWIHSVILPADTPARDMGNSPIAGTGPYRIAEYDPTTVLKLERNPYFQEWSHNAQPAAMPDEVHISFGLDSEAAVTAVENGQADWMYENVPLDRLGEVGSRYADQVRIYTPLLFYYATLNVHEPPFTSLKVRQALNYAVNRHAMIIYRGGSAVASPSCQILPKGTPGYEPFCFYTFGASPTHPAISWVRPDMQAARHLVEESGMAGHKVTIIVPSEQHGSATAEDIRNTLETLGFKATVRSVSPAIAFTYIQNTQNHVQIALTGWNADYPSASSFLRTLFSCQTFHPNSDNSPNYSGFCDPHIDQLMDKAAMLALTDRVASNQAWAKVDREIMAQAPLVPLSQTQRVVLLSKRAKNIVTTLNDEILFSQIQLK
ncbi:ABC transporter substrate-binding protein [Acetobacter syzygii]|uniref:ABC transporter substrate-binding protein n=1 Tax=Acetobacter syzygii TaxID=146476 RepID=UPI00156FD6A2|nr:ABC transporter substrate-binding protein [Acetobacter syzygii]